MTDPRQTEAELQLAASEPPEQALQRLADLLNRDPTAAAAWAMAGHILRDHGEFTQAIDAFRRVVELAPANRTGRHSLAQLLIDHGSLAEAESMIGEMVTSDTLSPEVWALLAALRQKQVRDAEAAAALRHALALGAYPIYHSNLLQILQYSDEVTLNQLLAEHRAWDATYAAGPAAKQPPVAKRHTTDGPLRLGFVSADFGRHPTGFLALAPIEFLDRTRCSVICYYDRLPEDEWTARFRAAADAWHVASGWSNERLAEQIRRDEIDILFDLMGHTGPRLPVFAMRPAPMQVTWLGYVGTTGLAAMDFLLADRFHVRPGEEVYYAERILRMPHDYVCYGPPANAPEVALLPALATGVVTFGCFNNAAKLTPRMLDAWAEILQGVPTSRLLLKNRSLNQPELQDRIHVHFCQHPISPQRVLLEEGAPHNELLASYGRVDLALDTQPYSGGLTTCEALWMGVPVITFPGRTFAGRHSVSHLTNAGNEQFVAADLDGYIRLAIDWAGRIDELAAGRVRMREQVRRSSLCDAQQFATDFLTLFQQAWSQAVLLNEP